MRRSAEATDRFLLHPHHSQATCCNYILHFQTELVKATLRCDTLCGAPFVTIGGRKAVGRMDLIGVRAGFATQKQVIVNVIGETVVEVVDQPLLLQREH